MKTEFLCGLRDNSCMTGPTVESQCAIQFPGASASESVCFYVVDTLKMEPARFELDANVRLRATMALFKAVPAITAFSASGIPDEYNNSAARAVC